MTKQSINSGRLPEKPHGSMNWTPVTMLDVTNNKTKEKNNEKSNNKGQIIKRSKSKIQVIQHNTIYNININMSVTNWVTN